jgi:hypothetical protein
MLAVDFKIPLTSIQCQLTHIQMPETSCQSPETSNQLPGSVSKTGITFKKLDIRQEGLY